MGDRLRLIVLRWLLPAHGREGLLPAVLSGESLLASQEAAGARRWQSLDSADLDSHVEGHAREVRLGVQADRQTGHPTTAHLSVRALMRLARYLESPTR